MLCRISHYFNCHVACFSLAFLWSPVVCSKHPFRAMCCPVNVYCDRDISCIVIVTYHVLISVRGGSRKNRDIRIYDHAHLTTPKFLLCNPEIVLGLTENRARTSHSVHIAMPK